MGGEAPVADGGAVSADVRGGVPRVPLLVEESALTSAMADEGGGLGAMGAVLLLPPPPDGGHMGAAFEGDCVVVEEQRCASACSNLVVATMQREDEKTIVDCKEM